MVVAMTNAGPGCLPSLSFTNLIMASMFSAPLNGTVIHWFFLEALRFLQKLLIILSARVNRFSSPVGTNSVKKQLEQLINNRSIEN